MPAALLGKVLMALAERDETAHDYDGPTVAPPLRDRCKLKCVASVEGGCTPSKSNPDYWSGAIPWVSPKDMKVRVIRDSEDHVSEEALRETSLRLIDPPVILIVVRGMILAHTLPVAVTAARVTINQDMKGLRSRVGVSTEYLAYFLEGTASFVLSTMVEESAHGTKCLRADVWQDLSVLIPTLDEQRALAAFPKLTAWVHARSYRPAAVTAFLQDTDYHLVAYALAHGHVVVTHEIPSDGEKRVKIPDACIGVDVKYVTPLTMLRRERARFVLGQEVA